jgi:hypothetical protein
VLKIRSIFSPAPAFVDACASAAVSVISFPLLSSIAVPYCWSVLMVESLLCSIFFRWLCR